MHKVFWAICAVGVVIQCIVIVWVWVSTGEVSYKHPRDLFGAAPKDRIRRADTPVWYWCNVAAAVLTHVIMLAFFVFLIRLRWYPP
jgi:hypothetical protein